MCAIPMDDCQAPSNDSGIQDTPYQRIGRKQLKRLETLRPLSERKPETMAWDQLPQSVLVEIYQCVDDRSRGCMARVCRNWYLVFLNPILWRVRSVAPKPNDCEFARQFGCHVVDLTLNFSPPWKQDDLMTLFHHLLKARIHSLKIRELQKSLDTYRHRGQYIWKCLQLRSVRDHLQAADLRLAKLTPDDGISLLRKLPTTITSLQIQELVSLDIGPAYHIKKFNWTEHLQRFSALTCLYFSCDYVDDDKLRQLADSRLGKQLRVFGLWLQGLAYNVTSPSVWRQLTAVNGQLRVSAIIPDRAGDSVLVSGMPIESLTLTSQNVYYFVISCEYVATYLRGLVRLDLKVDSPKYVQVEMKKILTSCTKLRYLSVIAKMPLSCLASIFSKQILVM